MHTLASLTRRQRRHLWTAHCTAPATEGNPAPTWTAAVEAEDRRAAEHAIDAQALEALGPGAIGGPVTRVSPTEVTEWVVWVTVPASAETIAARDARRAHELARLGLTDEDLTDEATVRGLIDHDWFTARDNDLHEVWVLARDEAEARRIALLGYPDTATAEPIEVGRPKARRPF